MGAEVKDVLVVKELHTGAYNAEVATESIGYITIIDETGTARKVMIQA